MPRLLPNRLRARAARYLMFAAAMSTGLLPLRFGKPPAGQAAAVAGPAIEVAAVAFGGPWRAHEGVEMASRLVAVALEAKASHTAAQTACEAHWGRELGRVLCPALLAANDGRGLAPNVELGLLAALWHLSCHRAGWALGWARVQASRLGAYARPLLTEDPL